MDTDQRPTAIVLARSGPSPLVGLLVGLLEAAGFEIPGGPVVRALDLVERAADVDPALVILDVGQAGAFGMRLVPVIRTVAPHAVVHVIVPLDTLGQAATAAGADGAFLEADLRGLRQAVTQLAQALLRR